MLDEQFDGQEQTQVAQSDTDRQLDEGKKKAAEYLDNWKRAVADLANYKKRVEKDRSEYLQYANGRLLAKLLDVMDGFDAAFKAVPPQFKNEPWVEGMRLVEKQLRRVLETEDVKPIEAEGKDFDPNFHEAMVYETSPGVPEGKVTADFQRGYMLGDRVLRPSRVKVAKGEER